MMEQLSDGDMDLIRRTCRFFQGCPDTIRSFLLNLKSAVVQDNCLKILILLTITGLILRLWHIGDVSFWFDETLTNFYSRHTFIEIWHIGTDGVNPPTFYWIEHIMLYFGSGEALLRLIPALAGTCTIPVFYLLGREFHNRETGLAAAALLTVSSFHIYYSQEARPYTLLLFFYSITLLFCLRSCKTSSLRPWVLFGFFSALSCWAHLFGFIFVFPLFVFIFFGKIVTGKTGIGDLKPVILAGAIWVLFSLPMLLVTVKAGISKVQTAESWGSQGIVLIISTIRQQFGQYNAGVIILCFLFIAGLVCLLRNDRKRFLFIAVAITLPLIITVVLSYRMSIAPRYLIGLLPFVLLSIAYLIGSVRYRFFTVRFSCIAILLLIVISIPSLDLYYSADSKFGQDYKGLSPKLHNLTKTGDTILIYPANHALPLTYYYHNGTEQTSVSGINSRQDLEGFILQNPDRKKILLIIGSKNMNRAGEIETWIATHADLVDKQGELLVYRVR